MADIDDLRILRLAAMYEEAFGAFVRRESERDLDERARLKLAPLAAGRTKQAERVRAMVARLEAQADHPDAAAAGRAALLDIAEVERASREFYLRHLDQLHDPEVVQLFHELAAQEGRHVRLAENAIETMERARRSEAKHHDDAFRTIPSGEPPLWEGTVDLDPAPKRRSGAPPP